MFNSLADANLLSFLWWLQDKMIRKKAGRTHENKEAVLYMVALLSTLSAAMVYFIYLWIFEKPCSLQIFNSFCISGAFHWFPFTIVAYATMHNTAPSSALNFSISVAVSYLAHGLILSFLTCTLNSILSKTQVGKKPTIRTWFRHRIVISSHQRFDKFISGTEAFCIYL